MNLKDSFARIKDGEVFLVNASISTHDHTSLLFNHKEKRLRKLLLHSYQIRKLQSKTQQSGLTLVPVSAYLKGQRLKIELALARGKKLYDKRQELKAREEKREISRVMKNF
eukprot:CAMPEP_0196656686 /NCGR_PEP_ID=MMETSP1086-20130531/19384_1 /TAXON_ID=77921 /ORGANISM="Cyanoptyche  gloeocystis , Strain SAG4.97" /LENGTH=110 /DNA_ID=CAMNT_0041989535 /DNA_START=407 /DNA_END=739 /DNA_ORIENTATION=-